MSLSRSTFFLILVGTALWCAGILAAPLLAAQGVPSAETMYGAFHQVCHQFENRTLHLAGKPLAVCSRCAAIYFGFFAGVLAYPFLRRVSQPRVPSWKMVAAACLPMVLDVVSGMMGLHEITTTTRLITGAAFGVLMPFVIVPVAIEAASQLVHSSNTLQPQKGVVDAGKTQ